MTNVLYGALLAATVSPPVGRQAAPAADWVWPVQPPVVVRAFDPPPTPYSAGHRGIDLAAVAGQPVDSAGAGVVSFAGQVAGIGVVVIRHDGGLRTTYEPVAPAVTAGQSVAAGALIGQVTGGHLGCTVCLHFGLRSGVDYLDPLLLFARGPVRLLPVDGPAQLSAQLTTPLSTVGADASAPTTPRRGHLALVPPLTADAVAVASLAGGSVVSASVLARRRGRRRASPPP